MNERPDTESLTDGVTGFDSLHVPSSVKPVVKTTPLEALSLKRKGEFGADKVIFRASPKVAYIMDIQGVHDMVGADTVTNSLNIAKKWLRIGGNAESELLGYPNRDGIDKSQTVDVAVSKDGEIVTDLDAMRGMVSNGQLAWAAEGEPEEAHAKAKDISNAIKKALG